MLKQFVSFLFILPDFLILFFSQPYLGLLGVWCGDYELISSIQLANLVRMVVCSASHDLSLILFLSFHQRYESYE